MLVKAYLTLSDCILFADMPLPSDFKRTTLTPRSGRLKAFLGNSNLRSLENFFQ